MRALLQYISNTRIFVPDSSMDTTLSKKGMFTGRWETSGFSFQSHVVSTVVTAGAQRKVGHGRESTDESGKTSWRRKSCLNTREQLQVNKIDDQKQGGRNL